MSSSPEIEHEQSLYAFLVPRLLVKRLPHKTVIIFVLLNDFILVICLKYPLAIVLDGVPFRIETTAPFDHWDLDFHLLSDSQRWDGCEVLCVGFPGAGD